MGLETDFKKYASTAVTLKSERYALWTDASLFPPADVEQVEQVNPVALSRDWQSFGQQLIHYAASRTMQDLFPIGKAFFRLSAGKRAAPVLARAMQLEPEALEGTLVEAANTASSRLHWRGNFSRLSWGLKVLFATGNVLFHKRADGVINAYTTRNYSIKRDGAGSPLRLILRERHALRMLPEEVRLGFSQGSDPEELVDVFTGVEWLRPEADGTQLVSIWQEAGEWRSDALKVDALLNPFIPLPLDLIPGESYGRGRVEANSGDFARYSELSRALTLYEIEACRVVKGVRQGAGVTDLDSLNDAETGEFVMCDPDAVKPMEFGDARKIAELRQELQAIETRLARTFGYGGNMREGERVTAYEISLSAAETDRAQGGLYSALSASLHIPLALLMLQETNPMLLAAIKASLVDVGVLTGITALGQSADIQALLRASQEASLITSALGGISAKYSPERIGDLALLAAGFVPERVERTEEELQEMQASAAPLNPADPQNLVNAIEGTVQSV